MEISICTICTIYFFSGLLIVKIWSINYALHFGNVNITKTLFILGYGFGKFNSNFPVLFLTLILSDLQIVQVMFLVPFHWSVNFMI